MEATVGRDTGGTGRRWLGREKVGMWDFRFREGLCPASPRQGQKQLEKV